MFFFENCVIEGQYEEYVLRPEVSPTPASGCFAMAQTERQTNKQTDQHGNYMTESNRKSKPGVHDVRVGNCPLKFLAVKK